ncbi:universal stress protein [Geodermatophilus sp. YIM 151500]|uniref:universal stress protein n=1 Tax=Geodermatophilus sp. YIM 151500 TaxID=2984531 RepID=UPI0021E3F3DC|nr:universal stress protein [Geodermatophilus sp. YIM 151500]MCV2490211.1 universal stress protein [Geodermatophilus sp. YIM 151500]
MSETRPSLPAPEPEPGAEQASPPPTRHLQDAGGRSDGRSEGSDGRPGGSDGPSESAPARRSSRPTEVDTFRLPALLPRRHHPWLLVEVDDSPGAHSALVWALREAARREATVVAVSVLDDPDGDPLGGGGRASSRAHEAARERLEAQLLRAIAETGVHGRSRTAVVDRVLHEALCAAGRGADLVLVGTNGKALLRQAVPRPPARRLARGA